jgi:hypothetical protein
VGYKSALVVVVRIKKPAMYNPPLCKKYIIVTKHTSIMRAEGIVLWEELATFRLRS